MIEQGYLCDVKAIAIRTETSLDTLHTEGGDYREQELEAAIDTPERNQRVVEAYREHACGRRAICFAVTVQHARNLAHAFTAASIPAAFVCGEKPLCERKRLYHALRREEIKVLTNVQMLCEGFDEPLVDGVIMARPTQSRALCAGTWQRTPSGPGETGLCHPRSHRQLSEAPARATKPEQSPGQAHGRWRDRAGNHQAGRGETARA
jgi:superfamily II DNA or RNA helicase